MWGEWGKYKESWVNPGNLGKLRNADKILGKLDLFQRGRLSEEQLGKYQKGLGNFTKLVKSLEKKGDCLESWVNSGMLGKTLEYQANTKKAE